jgi:hypothetical protein
MDVRARILREIMEMSRKYPLKGSGKARKCSEEALLVP